MDEEFTIGDTVATGYDMEIVAYTFNEKISVIIPKGTKAFVQVLEDDTWRHQQVPRKPHMRLFFGFKSAHFDSWSMPWNPQRSRKVLIEKTIDIFKYDTDEKFRSALIQMKEKEEDTHIEVPRFISFDNKPTVVTSRTSLSKRQNELRGR